MSSLVVPAVSVRSAGSSHAAQVGVRLLDDGASLRGPRTASTQVNLLDGGAFTQVGRTRGGDGQQNILADLGMTLGRPLLEGVDASRQLAHKSPQLANDVVGLAHATSFIRGEVDQSGIRPCFFGGRSSRLAERFSNVRASLRRVSDGSMMSSTRPRAAETYGVEKVSRYTWTSSARLATGSSASAISLRKTTPAAPSAPITAISAVGHANT